METNNAKKKWIALISAVGCVLLALMIAVTCVMYSFREYMDQFLGRGDRVVTDSGEGLDADYIDCQISAEAPRMAATTGRITARVVQMLNPKS